MTVCCDPPCSWPTVCARKNGELLAVFSGDRDEHVCPFGKVQMVRSADGGRTWDVASEIKLAGHFNGDLGYPASAELPDGRILTVYYQAEKKGEKTCLTGTLWKVKKE